MNLSITFAAGALTLLFSMGAQAQAISYTLSAAPGPTTDVVDFSAGLPLGFSGGKVYQTTLSGTALQPNPATGAFWSISVNQTGVVDMNTLLGAPAMLVGFLWGSPDFDTSGRINTVTFKDGANAVASFDSSQVFSSVFSSRRPPGTNLAASYVTFNIPSTLHVTSAEFTTTKIGFEIDNLRVSAVPEPAGYALALAGVSVLVGLARRRQRSDA